MNDVKLPIQSYLLLALLVAVAAACSASGADAVRLVKQADAKLKGSASGSNPGGGLEFSSVRADMKAQYDEALRIADQVSLSEADDKFVRSHAHFGLAMNRLFDLAERLEIILEEGGVLEALKGVNVNARSGDASAQERPSYCQLFEDFDALQSIVELLLQTSLTPIIDDLRAAIAADPNVSVQIERARYDLSNFVAEAGGNNYIEFAAIYGAADMRLLLGGFEVVSGALNFLFAYQDVFANLFLFSFVEDNPSHGQYAKLYNSNPCAENAELGNPLLNPDFGILVNSEKMALAQQLLGSGLGDIGQAIADATSTDPELHFLGEAGAGEVWGSGLVELADGADRFSLEVAQENETPLQGFAKSINLIENIFRKITPLVDRSAAADLFLQAGDLIKAQGRWDVRAALDPVVSLGGIAGLLNALGSGQGAGAPQLADMELLHIDFGNLFSAPPGDFRTFLPQYYLADEPYTDANNNGVRDLKQGLLWARDEADYENNEDYLDINCNGRWDQRGDFVVQHEFEPFEDANLNSLYDAGERAPTGSGFAPPALGFIGAFVDANADAKPDRGLIDGQSQVEHSSGKLICGQSSPVTWPASQDDPDFALGKIKLGPSDPVTAPFGSPFTEPSPGENSYNGSESVLGQVVGHYWFPRSFDLIDWPGQALADPANGTIEQDYLFYSDPTLGGWLLRDRNSQPNPAVTNNAWLNRLLTQWSDLSKRFGL